MKQYKQPLTDGHIHVYTSRCIDYFFDYINRNAFKAIDIACLCNLDKSMEHDGAQNILAAIMKCMDPDSIYAHAGLVYPVFPVDSVPKGEYDFAEQAKEFMEIGFDGIKMLENKPTVRKLTGLATCSDAYDGFYSFLEKNRIHIVSHVADPETFWDYELAPEFSHTEGWFYGDGSFLTKESIYNEVKTTLEKFPNLRITFPHFFFLSDYINEARLLLEKYPNINLDITPGREMYDNFTRHYKETKEFFENYSGRIIFGTDMTSEEFQGEPSEMIDAITRFLSTEDVFEYWGFEIRGIGLSGEKCRQICFDNHAETVGKKPREINKKALAKYIDRMLPYVRDKQSAEFILNFRKKEL